MKSIYLKKILYAGVGKTYSHHTDNKKTKNSFSPDVHIQQPLQNRLPFPCILAANRNDNNDLFDPESENMGEEGLVFESGQNSEQLMKDPKTNITRDISQPKAFHKDTPSKLQKGSDNTLQPVIDVTDLKMEPFGIKQSETKDLPSREINISGISKSIDIREIPTINPGSRFDEKNLQSEELKSYKFQATSEEKPLVAKESKTHTTPPRIKEENLDDPGPNLTQKNKNIITEKVKLNIKQDPVAMHLYAPVPDSPSEEKPSLRQESKTHTTAPGIIEQNLDDSGPNLTEKNKNITAGKVKIDIKQEPGPMNLYAPVPDSPSEEKTPAAQESKTHTMASGIKEENLDYSGQNLTQKNKNIITEKVKLDIKQDPVAMHLYTPVPDSTSEEKPSLPQESKTKIFSPRNQDQDDPQKKKPLKHPARKAQGLSNILYPDKPPKAKVIVNKHHTNIHQQAMKQNLFASLVNNDPKRRESQIDSIRKDIALLSKKMDEHLKNEQRKPPKPAYLPQRPASKNLGGWSALERLYIR